MYKELSIAYETIADELGIRKIPVGDAFFADTDPRYGFRPDPLFDVNEAKYPILPNQNKSLHVGWRWQRPQNQPEKWLLHIDGHHANAAGEYLGSCVWYEVLFPTSKRDIRYMSIDHTTGYEMFQERAIQYAMTTLAL